MSEENIFYLHSVLKKLEIANKLFLGEIGGGYFEAMLIISSILSATASILWPGVGIDKKRFIELLVKYNTTQFDLTRISIPILNESRNLTKYQEDVLLKKYNTTSYSKILTSDDIDVDEITAVDKLPELKKKILRKYSYANLFYTELRSSIVHEYRTSGLTSSYPMTKKKDIISYSNNLKYPFRRIVFHFDEIKSITENIAYNVAEIFSVTPIERPAWWIDG